MPTADNTLVLVIDIQERLLPALSQAEAFSAAAVRFIEGCRLLGGPLLLTEQYPKGLGAPIEPVSRACADALRFEKTRFSAYTPEVAAAIAQKQPENIVLIGCETHICVLQTALDLLAQGVRVYALEDALTSRTEANKANGLRQMQAAGAIVSNSESVLFQFLGDAKHPQFKAISKLIQ